MLKEIILKIHTLDFKARGLKSDEFKTETWKPSNNLSICLTTWENHENLEEEVWSKFLRASVQMFYDFRRNSFACPWELLVKKIRSWSIP